MDYNEKLDAAIARLHDEGRYRTFIDIERRNGQFPHAVWTKPDGSQQDITVWCGNDYLGMGQNPVVLEAMEEALRATGAGSGGTRNISGTTVYHKKLEAELADLHAAQAVSGADHLFRRAEPRVDDRRRAPQWWGQTHFPPQRSGPPARVDGGR